MADYSHLTGRQIILIKWPVSMWTLLYAICSISPRTGNVISGKASLQNWGLTEENAKDFKGNPIDNLAPLAAAGIPVMGVCGDSDKIVPYEKHMKIAAERYRALGGNVEIILKPGCDHHPIV